MPFCQVGHTGPSATVDAGVFTSRKGSGGRTSLCRGAAHSYELRSTPGKAGPGREEHPAQQSTDPLGNMEDLEAPVVPRSQFGNWGALSPPCSQVGSPGDLCVVNLARLPRSYLTLLTVPSRRFSKHFASSHPNLVPSGIISPLG